MQRKASPAIQLAIRGPLRCRKLAFSLVTGKKGIEIGGPSAVFLKLVYLPIYDKVASLDNCDFRQDNVWATHKSGYRFHKDKSEGKMYICEGSDLGGVPDDSYDFLLSSHSLEHMANPIKALKEWQRVVKPGGSLLIVLPNYARTFDRNRKPTTLKHMLEDYQRGTGEDDLTHFNEVYNATPNPSRRELETRDQLWNNLANRMIHHHVFDESNSRELLEAVGLRVLAVEGFPPYHIVLIAEVDASPGTI